MKFKYIKFPLDFKSNFFGSSILKPIIPVKIINGEAEIKYGALIDSGADFCIFDAEIGENIGIDIMSGQKEIFGGIQGGNNARAFLHKIDINIGGYEYSTVVGFSYDIANYGYGILGQKGFFDLFVVKFGYLKEEIELKEKNN